MKTYNIAYATDENYARNLGISLTSLLRSNKEIENIEIYIIENKIVEETKKKINEIGKKYGRNINFINCEELCKDLDKVLDKNIKFPKAAYSKVFLYKIKNIDKILFLDSDTIIKGSIKELYDTNIDNYYIGAVQDNAAYYLLKKIGMDKDDRYINSGVVLMNLKKWREDKIEDKIFKFIKIHNGKVNHHDQGILNGVCKKNILILNPKYNLMPEMIYLRVKQSNFLYNVYNYYSQQEIDNAVENPIIIHYIEKFYSRPWKKDCEHPMKNLYLDILESSEFNKELDSRGMNKKVQLRKKIYDKCPFIIYAIFEKILDVRRRFL